MQTLSQYQLMSTRGRHKHLTDINDFIQDSKALFRSYICNLSQNSVLHNLFINWKMLNAIISSLN